MSSAKKRPPAVADPLTRACPACGARKGEGCSMNIKDSKLVAFASRLVHADRLGERSDG